MIFCADNHVLKDYLLAAEEAGITSGSHALFIMQAHNYINPASFLRDLIVESGDPSIQVRLRKALEAAFILTAQPFPRMIDDDDMVEGEVRKNNHDDHENKLIIKWEHVFKMIK